jgi:hypothetical protein
MTDLHLLRTWSKRVGECGHLSARDVMQDAGAEIESLRAALTEALDGYADACAYKDAYLVKKHGDLEDIARLREVLPK